jgi:serine/threonine-protein phosphatase 2B catalytic subunit
MSNKEYFQNALYQIKEKSPYIRPRDIPENTTERHVPSVPPPAAYIPTDEQFYTTDPQGRRRPNPDFIREHFLREGRLNEEHALAILRRATDVLSNEPNVLRIKSPVTGASIVTHTLALAQLSTRA